MKKILKTCKNNPNVQGTLKFYFGNSKYCILDIETSGLSHKRDFLILSGIITCSPDKSEEVQFFAENPDDEKCVLEATLDVLRDCDFLITYNGKIFDIPFLIARAKCYSLDIAFLDSMFNLDMYSIIRKHAPFATFLPNLKQKTVEDFIGIYSGRSDIISGKESAALYDEFLKKGSTETLNKILLHNSDDIVQLHALMKIFDFIDIHKTFFYEGVPSLGIQSIKIGSSLAIDGKNPYCIDFVSFSGTDDVLSIDSNKNTSKYRILLPLEEKNCYIYADTSPFIKDDCISSEIKKSPNYISGFLILKKNDFIYYKESNLMAMLLARHAYSYICTKSAYLPRAF